jgi:glutaminase
VLQPEVSRNVDDRVVELYRRALAVGDDGVEAYYVSGRGYVAPEDLEDPIDHLAIAGVTLDGVVHHSGACDFRFPLQSISKVFAYALALQDHGRDAVLPRVGVEPSGDAFSSITFDERHNRPHNPMVNAGALATTNLVRGADFEEKLDRIVDLVRRCAGSDGPTVDDDLAALEVGSADRNRATAYLMRSRGMVGGDVEKLLALYLHQCAITLTCDDLARVGATLADGGLNPVTQERVLEPGVAQDVLTVMYTCGMYDFAGEWAFQVGLPAKSGVSGGILAAIPGKFGLAVYSPGLDEYGNSVRGVRVCQAVSQRLGLHVFAAEREDTLLGLQA